MVACLSYACTTTAATTATTTNNNDIGSPSCKRRINHHYLSHLPLTSRRKQTRFDSREAIFLLRRSNNFQQFKQIHAQILRNGLSQYPFLLTKLLHRLHTCSSSPRYIITEYISTLLKFHPGIPSPPFPTFTWNRMIRFHTLPDASPHLAITLYHLMLVRGIPPDSFTFPFLIRACLFSSSISHGKAVHARSIRSGFSQDTYVQNTLMDLYFKCGSVDYGRKVFNKMHRRSVVSWTTVIGGLISFGELESARAIFELMPTRNVVSWTTMINGYARNKQPHEAFELFQRMKMDNVKSNEYTLVSLLVACTEIGSLELGRWIHDFAHKNGFQLGAFLGTALIDMYSKCGSLEDAKKVFDNMWGRSLATWNSMITSLGVHGRGDEALALFNKMEELNIEPDAITFVGVLCACLNGGLVDEGCRYFKYMKDRYDITPIVDHYVCMIELLSGAGMLDEAYELVNIMPMKPSDEIMEALVRAERDNGSFELGEHVAEDVDHDSIELYAELEH